jgi:hypothetical protein
VSRKTLRKMARSGTAECPICRKQRLLVEHHIHGRDIPNFDAPWNRAYICAACHDDVHAGKVVVEGWVATTAGKILAFRRAGEPQDCLEGAKPRLYASQVSEGP